MYLNTPTPFCRVNLFCLPGPGAPPSGVNCESKYKKERIFLCLLSAWTRRSSLLSELWIVIYRKRLLDLWMRPLTGQFFTTFPKYIKKMYFPIAIVVAIVFVFYRCFPFLRLLAFVYFPPRCDNQLESQEPSTDFNLNWTRRPFFVCFSSVQRREII